ncbi:hypothetical protein KAX22_07380, partial [bacterium]|nr:hypothetical protein [bacterium]
MFNKGEVYLTDDTDGGGNAFFTPSPSTSGTMYVTVTKHNYLPYEGDAMASCGPPPAVTDLQIALNQGDLVLTWST